MHQYLNLFNYRHLYENERTNISLKLATKHLNFHILCFICYYFLKRSRFGFVLEYKEAWHGYSEMEKRRSTFREEKLKKIDARHARVGKRMHETNNMHQGQ